MFWRQTTILGQAIDVGESFEVRLIRGAPSHHFCVVLSLFVVSESFKRQEAKAGGRSPNLARLWWEV